MVADKHDDFTLTGFLELDDLLEIVDLNGSLDVKGVEVIADKYDAVGFLLRHDIFPDITTMYVSNKYCFH